MWHRPSIWMVLHDVAVSSSLLHLSVQPQRQFQVQSSLLACYAPTQTSRVTGRGACANVSEWLQSLGEIDLSPLEVCGRERARERKRERARKRARISLEQQCESRCGHYHISGTQSAHSFRVYSLWYSVRIQQNTCVCMRVCMSKVTIFTGKIGSVGHGEHSKAERTGTLSGRLRHDAMQPPTHS